MKLTKLIKKTPVFLLFGILFTLLPNSVQAALPACSNKDITVIEGLEGDYEFGKDHTITLNFSNTDLNDQELGVGPYRYLIRSPKMPNNNFSDWKDLDQINPDTINLSITYKDAEIGRTTTEDFEFEVVLQRKSKIIGIVPKNICKVGTYIIPAEAERECKDMVMFQSNPNGSNECYYPGCLLTNELTTISGKLYKNDSPYQGTARISFYGISGEDPLITTSTDGSFTTTKSFDSAAQGKFSIRESRLSVDTFCKYDLNINNLCTTDQQQCSDKEIKMPDEDEEIEKFSKYNVCSQIIDSNMEQECNDCYTLHSGIWTAFGCIPTNTQSIVKALITIGLMLSGGVALLMILVTAFLLSISQGNPDQVGKAKELFVSAVVGLLFVIFSTTILQFIGYNILRIPGFGE
jgi:hypothetical protein